VKTEYAYIAGLFDGEGTIHISNQLYLAARLRNTNRLTLEWIQRLYGFGHIYSDTRRVRPCYSLEFASNQALEFLKPLLPYLRIKKTQANLAFKFQKRESNPQSSGYPLYPSEETKRKYIYEQMKQLNHPIIPFGTH